MQQQLFSSEGTTPSSKSLVINKTGKQNLSKDQEAFNRLTKKIEKLQKEIEKKQLEFDLAMKLYGTEFHPAQVQVLQARHKLITVLWGIYKSYKLSKTDQRHLKDILQFQLSEYFNQSETEPDKTMQQIFSEIEGISYDKMMQQENESETSRLKNMFNDLDIDMDDVDMNDATAMAAKIAEAEQKITDQQERKDEQYRQRQENRKKTAKQLENEKMQKAVEEKKQKNISTIYKQLAKLFHPDLEQDAEKKIEKEILMKELVSAYEAKNLHALLTLELKWIHKETDHLENLTEEKLTVYLQILREQARDLEHEKYQVINQPQYAALLQSFGYTIARNPVKIMQENIKSSIDILHEFEHNIADFESDMALRHVKQMIKQWKDQDKELDEDDILRILLG
jgi:hypothetical protein